MVFLQAFTIEWTIGNLDATIAYTNYTCNIDVYYPAGTFPDGTTIYNQADMDGECCAQFVSECETDSVVAIISNGTFDSATLNGASLSSGFAGQSSLTFDTNSTTADLVTCVTPNSTGVVYISYVTYFANGEKCESRVEMDCKAIDPEPSSCCPELDFKLKPVILILNLLKYSTFH
jgi:hypothetical protein